MAMPLAIAPLFLVVITAADAQGVAPAQLACLRCACSVNSAVT